MSKKMKGASLEQAMPKPSSDQEDYETEDHLRTLHKASEIMKDKPKLKKIHALAGRKHKAVQDLVAPHLGEKKIRSTDDLREIREKKSGKSDEEME